MRKTVVILMCLMSALNVLAQDKAELIKDIRKAYAEAKQDIANNGKDGPRMDVRIAISDGSEVSEDFIINEDQEITYYFKRIRQSGDTDLFQPSCYFLTEETSANGHTVWREMLFDPFSGHLRFSYMKAETHAGFVIESRYYYDDLGNLIEQKHKAGGEETTADGQSWSSGGGDQTMGMVFMAMFNALMEQKGATSESYTAMQTADKATQMKHIRSLYEEAKQKVAKDAQSEIPRNVLIEIHDQEDPALPPQTDVLHFWFDHVGEDGNGSCYFMSSVCEMGDLHVYSEYLFEPKEPRLLFCFSQQAQNDGTNLEWRYYFDNNGRCIEAKGSDDRLGPGFADKKAANVYMELFNGWVNPEW